MKINELLNAYPALNRLYDKKFKDYNTTRRIVKLKNTVDTEINFYSEQERKLVEQYALKDEYGNPKITDGNKIEFKNTETKHAYDGEIKKLLDVDVAIEKVKLSEKDFMPGDFPTPADMSVLDCIIDFE